MNAYRTIVFANQGAAVAVPFYRLLGVFLSEEYLLFRFDGLHLILKGESLGMLFEKFVEGRVWNLTAGHSYVDREERFAVTEIRFFDADVGRLASESGPCATADKSIAAADPEVKRALVRFERKLGNQRLAVLGSNLLNAASAGNTLHLLFEHWKVSVKDPEASALFQDFCDSKINVFKEGEALKELGTVCVQEIQIDSQEE
jgi:hypothetical protein